MRVQYAKVIEVFVAPTQIISLVAVDLRERSHVGNGYVFQWRGEDMYASANDFVQMERCNRVDRLYCAEVTEISAPQGGHINSVSEFREKRS